MCYWKVGLLPWGLAPDPKRGRGGLPPPPLYRLSGLHFFYLGHTPLYRLQHGCTEQSVLWTPEVPDILFRTYGRGNFFLFDHMCLDSKYSELCEEFNNG